MRKEACYLTYDSGQCLNPMVQPQTKMLCCCSMGAAWGNLCEKCPGERTRKYSIETICIYQMELMMIIRYPQANMRFSADWYQARS